MRALRVAAGTVQLALPDPALTDPMDRWWDLPETTRAHVLGLLAGLIARGVLAETTLDPESGAGGDDV